jgi:DNA mismatch endonuclease (patch repair protein)
MSRVKSRNTDLERLVGSALHRRGLRFRTHAKALPGRPDIVFPSARVAVFVDGDFWHGYRLPTWEHRLSPFWKAKLRGNRVRDQRNFRKLRAAGWRVIRLWQHEVTRDLDDCIARIAKTVRANSSRQLEGRGRRDTRAGVARSSRHRKSRGRS